MDRIVAAFLTTDSSILLRKILVSFRILKAEIEVNTKTAIVVVFIPPAVEPGDPPIIISIMIIARPDSDMVSKLTELNPAVRGVTA